MKPIRVEISVVARVWEGEDAMAGKPNRKPDLMASADVSRASPCATNARMREMTARILADIGEVLPERLVRNMAGSAR